MLPTAYEFHWDTGHVVFLGVFYSVVVTVLSILVYTALRGRGDLKGQRTPAIAWEETFHDLPADRRACRHAFDGPAAGRVCHHCFDCATCAGHPEFTAIGRSLQAPQPPDPGVPMPSDTFYHRGHTWVKPAPDGTLTLGLDPFAQRCFGHPTSVSLPAEGQTVQSGERAVTLHRGRLEARLAMPVAGEVVASSSHDGQWRLRVRPDPASASLVNLLRGNEARAWMTREVDWLQGRLNPAGGHTTLADGGVLMDDLVAAYPAADWDDLWGQVSLDV